MTDHVVLECNGVRYALPASDVLEIAGIPELSPMPDAPAHVEGAVDVRGRLAPVVDLALLTGHAPSLREVTDTVAFVNVESDVVGLIVHAVHDVVDFTDVKPVPATAGLRDLVSGVTHHGNEVVYVLSAHALAARVRDAAPFARPAARAWSDADARVLQERRARLNTRPDATGHQTVTRPVAVIGLGGERFGVDLVGLREFTDPAGVTPIPCCPPHVVGWMNLRGDILTLVDVRAVLGLPSADASTHGKVMVVEARDSLLGVLVDDVHDVTTVDSTTLAASPAAASHAHADYVNGTAPHGGGFMTLLDLQRILASDALTVKEEV